MTFACGSLENPAVHHMSGASDYIKDVSMHAYSIRSIAASLAIVVAGAPPVAAQSDAEVAALFDAMGLPQMIEIMREEGINYGAEIGEGLFQGRTSADWDDAVETIYDANKMKSRVLTQLTAELEGDDVAAMQDFFGSDFGQQVVTLEIAARRALLDDSIETASKEVAALAMADETPRYQLVTEFIDANDLVETNVAGALNSNFAFYRGLMQGGAMGDEMGEDEILATLWGQEPEIRQSTVEWVYSFLMLAYQPLSDEALQQYIDFSNSDAGQQINAAMFNAFDGVFEDISFALGFASTQVTQTEEL